MTTFVRHGSSVAPAVSSSTGGPKSVVTYRIGGRHYPYRSVANCKVCQSPHRADIETALLKGLSANSISKALPTDEAMSAESIRNHVGASHLPMDVLMQRVMVEERAQDQGIDLETHEGTLVSSLTLLAEVQQRVFERMAVGLEEPTVSDGISAARAEAALKALGGDGLGEEILQQAIYRYLDITAQTVGQEVMDRIGQALSSDPVIRTLRERWEQRQQEIEA